MTAVVNKVEPKEGQGHAKGPNREYIASLLQLVFLLENLPPQKRVLGNLCKIMQISQAKFFRLVKDLNAVFGIPVRRVTLVGESRLVDITTGDRNIRGYYFADEVGLLNRKKLNEVFLSFGTREETDRDVQREHLAFVQRTLEAVNSARKLYDLPAIEP